MPSLVATPSGASFRVRSPSVNNGLVTKVESDALRHRVAVPSAVSTAAKCVAGAVGRKSSVRSSGVPLVAIVAAAAAALSRQFAAVPQKYP